MAEAESLIDGAKDGNRLQDLERLVVAVVVVVVVVVVALLTAGHANAHAHVTSMPTPTLTHAHELDSDPNHHMTTPPSPHEINPTTT